MSKKHLVARDMIQYIHRGNSNTGRCAMAILSAENLFRKGLAALSEGAAAEAQALFHAAIQAERRRGIRRPQMRYLSFYGLSVALAKGATSEAVRACEVAARSEQANADLFLNLAKVYQMAGKLTRALDACERGLLMDPSHPALGALLAKLDRRQRPPLPFLRRSNALNRWLGKVRSALRAPASKTSALRRNDSFL